MCPNAQCLVTNPVILKSFSQCREGIPYLINTSNNWNRLPLLADHALVPWAKPPYIEIVGVSICRVSLLQYSFHWSNCGEPPGRIWLEHKCQLALLQGEPPFMGLRLELNVSSEVLFGFWLCMDLQLIFSVDQSPLTGKMVLHPHTTAKMQRADHEKRLVFSCSVAV